MKAIVIYEPGGPEKLICTDRPTPEVRPGWSLVKVKGFGVNHSEVFTRQGLSPSVRFPRVLGIECVGVISDTADPDRLPVGQKVISIMGEMGRAFDGGYAEYALLPNDQICPVDTDLDWTTLAALPETYYTAFGSFLNLRIGEGDKVLVRGGTSGVGVAFLRLVKGKFPGVSVTGTTRSAKKAGLLKQAGYDDVILETDGKLQTEERYTKVLELIGPATLMDTFAHTAEGGIVCSTGQLGHQWTIEGMDPIMDLPANGYLTSFYSGNVDGTKLQAMLDYVEKYRVDAAPARVFSLEQVPEAHAWLESGESLGKAVVLIAE